MSKEKGWEERIATTMGWDWNADTVCGNANAVKRVIREELERAFEAGWEEGYTERRPYSEARKKFFGDD